MYMSRRAKSAETAPARSDHVGTAEFRGNLAKYLRRVRAGGSVVIQERGRDAYLLSKFEPRPTSIFGCMRERTEYVSGSVVNAAEAWSAGLLP